MLLKRYPPPALRPFVKSLWVSDQTNVQRPAERTREHVLPTGEMHLVFRLSDQPLHLFKDDEDATGQILGCAIVGGARSTFYVRDISKPSCSVGAQLQPGAAKLLFGTPADELAERHTLLEDLWGHSANSAREQLIEAGSPGGWIFSNRSLPRGYPRCEASILPSPRQLNNSGPPPMCARS
jgi:hypothetical protein